MQPKFKEGDLVLVKSIDYYSIFYKERVELLINTNSGVIEIGFKTKYKVLCKNKNIQKALDEIELRINNGNI